MRQRSGLLKRLKGKNTLLLMSSELFTRRAKESSQVLVKLKMTNNQRGWGSCEG